MFRGHQRRKGQKILQTQLQLQLLVWQVQACLVWGAHAGQQDGLEDLMVEVEELLGEEAAAFLLVLHLMRVVRYHPGQYLGWKPILAPLLGCLASYRAVKIPTDGKTDRLWYTAQLLPNTHLPLNTSSTQYPAWVPQGRLSR